MLSGMFSVEIETKWNLEYVWFLLIRFGTIVEIETK